VRGIWFFYLWYIHAYHVYFLALALYYMRVILSVTLWFSLQYLILCHSVRSWLICVFASAFYSDSI
jgi:hypothetical protein